jgi:hypothetical protein
MLQETRSRVIQSLELSMEAAALVDTATPGWQILHVTEAWRAHSSTCGDASSSRPPALWDVFRPIDGVSHWAALDGCSHPSLIQAVVRTAVASLVAPGHAVLPWDLP